ncbi:hypothetical protein G7Y89_g11179 [Cudoniella acicularis]|uniref:Cytochrome P450 n=1 Tax=Cudoniella acicularis TaxID=354080 RepID=A0A8H4REZ0_9HELO|nr:hypothetical protein G7Y89_g11179 [Cudoniella acicularis]
MASFQVTEPTLEDFFPPKWTTVAALILLTLFNFVVYRLYFHPLAEIPGPRLYALLIIPKAYDLYRGRLPYRISELHDKYGPVPVNLVDWYNFTTFDVTGDLTFGDSFQCLHTSTLHDWVTTNFAFVFGAALIGMSQHFWPLTPLLMAFMPKNLSNAADEHARYTETKLQKQLKNKTGRPDFMTPIMNKINKPDGTSDDELLDTARAFMTGGSETVTTYLISGNPIPGNTIVAIDLFSAGRSSLNFTLPLEFIPERWLASPPSEIQERKEENNAIFQHRTKTLYW